MAGLRLAEMIRSYEQDLLDEIHFLKEKHTALMDVLLGTVKTSVVYDKRNFTDDLRALIVYAVQQRTKGITSLDDEGKEIPFTPTSDKMHKWIISQGCSLTGLTSHDMRSSYNTREQWIQALLVEFNRVM